DLADREREPGIVVEDPDAVLARLGLRHEPEVVRVETHRAPLIRDREREVVHQRAGAPGSRPGRTSRGGATRPASFTGGVSRAPRGAAPHPGRTRPPRPPPQLPV